MVYLAEFLVRDGEPRALCVRGEFGVFSSKRFLRFLLAGALTLPGVVECARGAAAPQS